MTATDGDALYWNKAVDVARARVDRWCDRPGLPRPAQHLAPSALGVREPLVQVQILRRWLATVGPDAGKPVFQRDQLGFEQRCPADGNALGFAHHVIAADMRPGCVVILRRGLPQQDCRLETGIATSCFAKPRNPPTLTMAYDTALSGVTMRSSTDPTRSFCRCKQAAQELCA
jgi:hypothetical protein